MNWYWASAAAVLLLLVVSLGLYLKNDTPDTQELFTAYFIPYEVPGNFRSENSPATDDTFRKAVSHYEEKQYQQAIALFDEVIEHRPHHAMAAFLRGISFLALDNAARAEADFKHVISDPHTLFMEQAKWYLALAHLKQGKHDVARALLDTLRGKSRDSNVMELWEDLK